MIVAWHEVPGTAPSHKRRPVGYGMIRAGVRTDSKIGGGNFECGIGKQNRNDPQMHGRRLRPCPSPCYPAACGISRARSSRTLRDGSFGGRFPGTSCLATISLSLWDKSHSPIEGHPINLALMGFTLGGSQKRIRPEGAPENRATPDKKRTDPIKN